MILNLVVFSSVGSGYFTNRTPRVFVTLGELKFIRIITNHGRPRETFFHECEFLDALDLISQG